DPGIGTSDVRLHARKKAGDNFDIVLPSLVKSQYVFTLAGMGVLSPESISTQCPIMVPSRFGTGLMVGGTATVLGVSVAGTELVVTVGTTALVVAVGAALPVCVPPQPARRVAVNSGRQQPRISLRSGR